MISTGNVLRIAARAMDCRVLGPGKRAVVWVYGCCFDCPGCIAQGFRNGRFEKIAPEELAEWYLASDAEGITISGGEPMLQAAELAELIRLIRLHRDCGVIVYTGFQYETLLKRQAAEKEISDFLSYIDLLIDGPYLESYNDNQPYRGSSNQRFLLLSDRYKDALENYYISGKSREIEIRISNEQTLLLGVPSKEQLTLWERIKRLGDNYGTEAKSQH